MRGHKKFANHCQTNIEFRIKFKVKAKDLVGLAFAKARPQLGLANSAHCFIPHHQTLKMKDKYYFLFSLYKKANWLPISFLKKIYHHM